MTFYDFMAPSETGYLFLLVIGFLSLAATLAVFVAAYRQRHGRSSEQPRAWRDETPTDVRRLP